ncbi:MAG: cytochrome c3 family protein [Pseudodesulfovibrio sp.]
MQRRLLPIAVATGILFVVALAGYLIPAPAAKPPVRILLENKGGPVIFSHKAHMETQGGQCGVCHHTSGEDQSPPACTSCHKGQYDEAFIRDHRTAMDKKQCAACHHAGATIANFSHDDHTRDYAPDNCRACHHDASIEPEPQACSNCHTDASDGGKPDLKTAAHTRCADCHDDFYQKGITGCDACHTRDHAAKTDPAPCSRCHDQPAGKLIPSPMAAFHQQCMACHEKQGAGPYGDAACNQCHMK